MGKHSHSSHLAADPTKAVRSNPAFQALETWAKKREQLYSDLLAENTETMIQIVPAETVDNAQDFSIILNFTHLDETNDAVLIQQYITLLQNKNTDIKTATATSHDDNTKTTQLHITATDNRIDTLKISVDCILLITALQRLQARQTLTTQEVAALRAIENFDTELAKNDLTQAPYRIILDTCIKHWHLLYDQPYTGNFTKLQIFISILESDLAFKPSMNHHLCVALGTLVGLLVGAAAGFMLTLLIMNSPVVLPTVFFTALHGFSLASALVVTSTFTAVGGILAGCITRLFLNVQTSEKIWEDIPDMKQALSTAQETVNQQPTVQF